MTISFSEGDTGAAVTDLQRKLASLDVRDMPELAALKKLRCPNPDSGATPCGRYGTETVAAVNAFKRRYRLGPEDGICDTATWNELNLQAGSVFSEVWQYELDALDGAPFPATVAPASEDLAQRAHGRELAGLAFSGGGVRSATFNLGILQALAELRLLRKFDYLSTVSGGGYIGAWFSRWLDREKGDIGKLEQALTPGAPGAPHAEADEVKFLRQYTNYLTPRTGFFSADTWALLATYVRNTTLNLAILVALLTAVMVLPRLLVTLIAQAPAGLPGRATPWPFAAVAIMCVLWSVGMIAANIASRPDPAETHALFRQTQGSVILFIVLPLMVAGCVGSVALWDLRDTISDGVHALIDHPGLDNALLPWIAGTGLAYFGAWVLGWGGAQIHNARLHRANAAAAPARGVVPQRAALVRSVLADGVGHLLCAVIALGLGTLAVLATTTWLNGVLDQGEAAPDMTVLVVAFGMPILLSIFGFTMVLCVGLVGRNYSDKSREWWSRQSGWTTIIVSGWVALVAVSLYVPGVLAWMNAQLFGPWLSALLASGWIATTAAGLLVGNSKATGASVANAARSAPANARLEWLARLAPAVFSVGALCLLAMALHHILRALSTLPAAPVNARAPFGAVLARYDMQTLASTWQTLVVVGLCLLVAGMLLAWRIDVNKFSLHMMYRNRLVRAYLGASNNERAPHPFTGFDPGDDMQLETLLKKNNDPGAAPVLQRPYHIINTTLNLVNGKELAWQSRKAAGFAFTPAFCGFELPRMASPGGAPLAQESLRGCFRATSLYTPPPRGAMEEEAGVQLGMAMAVSGAAASPSMGFHSSPPLAFLMTLFNVRLGRWFANPTCRVKRKAHQGAVAPTAPKTPSTSPRLGIRYLLRELFGLTDASSPFLYLSDGGHFENLGVYELVRRRCRLVVVVDAGADGQFDFSDLGNAIRKCATDLSVDVEIDVGKIDLLKGSDFSEAHCVTGRIRYDKIDHDGVIGTLLYIKPSLRGKEFADILNYRKINKTFPHQSTLDQWFDETQFETYRSLGYNIGKIVLERAVAVSQASVQQPGTYGIAALCTALHAAWDSAPPDAAAQAAQADRLYLVGDRRSGAERRRVPDPGTPERRQANRRA
jgi:peptidoglycan hydrolase-like protein with peptidoglycan-binding domain